MAINHKNNLIRKIVVNIEDVTDASVYADIASHMVVFDGFCEPYSYHNLHDSLIINRFYTLRRESSSWVIRIVLLPDTYGPIKTFISNPEGESALLATRSAT